MPQTGYCTDVTCAKELSELYECHCCSWMVCLKHLLLHVEVANREKKQQIEGLKNELETISSTLEVIVEKKVQEIEREKQLLQQAKTVMNKSAQTIDEIQVVYEEINQAIVANRKEETIVKVEPVLSEMKTCFSNDQLMTEAFEPPVVSSSSSNYILQQPPSPVYQPVIFRSVTNSMDQPARSSTPKRTDQSTDISHGFNSSGNSENIVTEEIQDNPRRMPGNSYRRPVFQCPLTFDSAFGINKAKDPVQLCPLDNFPHRDIHSHLRHKHCLKVSCSKRIYASLKAGQDPKTTILFDDNEEIIDREQYFPCPFSNNAIHLIGCCPTESRNIPCQHSGIRKYALLRHLKTYHRVPNSKAKEITTSYQDKLAKMKNTSNTNSS